MPLKYFHCPDNQTRAIEDCLNKCPRTEGRCLSLPTLATIGKVREWSGTPSTTQLLNPTRLEYLSIKKDFAINPFDQAFALLGTRHHYRLEQVAKKIEGLEAEVKLKGEVTGILDLLEPINGGEDYRLTDYKTFGSFAVKKAMEDGYDRHKLLLQLNNYRMMAQELGFNVTELRCQITVRDGGTYSARHNGIEDKLYFLPMEILPDEQVKEYFLTKAYLLCKAVENDVLPELCQYDERWGGRRCKGFCDVFIWCPEGAKVNNVRLIE